VQVQIDNLNLTNLSQLSLGTVSSTSTVSGYLIYQDGSTLNLSFALTTTQKSINQLYSTYAGSTPVISVPNALALILKPTVSIYVGTDGMSNGLLDSRVASGSYITVAAGTWRFLGEGTQAERIFKDIETLPIEDRPLQLIAGYDGTNIRPFTLSNAGYVYTQPSSSGTQTVSGTATVTQGTSPWVNNLTQLGSASISTSGGVQGTGTLRVVVASDQQTIPISAASLPLPAGAATFAAQQITNTDLGLIQIQLAGGLPAAIGQTTMVGSLSVVIASNQSTVPVSGTFWQATQPVSFSGTTAVSGTVTVNQAAAATGGYSYTNITASASALLKSGVGTLHTLVINTKGIGSTCTVYDSLTATGSKIATLDTTLSTTAFLYDAAFTTGLTVLTASGTPADLTVTWK